MKVAVLTIPAQQHRVWALMGHFDTLGFPVTISSRMAIYNGFDYKDYPVRKDALEAMVANGHTKYAEYLDGAHDNLINLDSHGDMCEWGLLNIMRKVIEDNHFTLVVENDAYFRYLPVAEVRESFAYIVEQWYSLVKQVGYENINVAMFTVIRPSLEESKERATLEDIDDFWVKGACGPGQTANIYTPHGAKMLLEDKPPYPNIETYLYWGDTGEGVYGDIPGVYSTRNGIIDLHFFSNFDSPHTVMKEPEYYFNLYRGVQL